MENSDDAGSPRVESRRMQRKRKRAGAPSKEESAEPEAGMISKLSFDRSREPNPNYTNRQKCLLFGSRNMSAKQRHLLLDFAGMLPHARRGSKFTPARDQSFGGAVVEICELQRCNSCLLLEAHKKEISYLWLAQVPNGPSMKLLLANIHTADELRLAGNCLKFSRALLHFDQEFETVPHLKIAKSLLQMAFTTPRYHPRSKPFIDHLIAFFYLDGRIWFRHYQIVPHGEAKVGPSKEVSSKDQDQTTEELAAAPAATHTSNAALEKLALLEIGPRFVMQPILLLNGTLQGKALWANKEAAPPTVVRQGRKERQLEKRVLNEALADRSERHREENPPPEPDPLSEVFL